MRGHVFDNKRVRVRGKGGGVFGRALGWRHTPGACVGKGWTKEIVGLIWCAVRVHRGSVEVWEGKEGGCLGLGWRYRWGQGGGPEKSLACLRQRGSPLRRVLALCSGTAGPPLGLRLKGVRGGVGRLPAGGPCVCGVVEPPNHVQAMGASPP